MFGRVGRMHCILAGSRKRLAAFGTSAPYLFRSNCSATCGYHSAGAWWDFFVSNSLHVCASPLANRLQCALERSAIFRQRVFHFWRNGGVNASRNYAVGLQLAELLDEHFLGYSRNQPTQLRKAIRILMQPPQNQSLPHATNHVDRCLHWTVIRFDLHERLPSLYFWQVPYFIVGTCCRNLKSGTIV